MRVPGLKSLHRLALWLRSRIVGGALILGYHRISVAPHDPYGLSVTPQHFAEQLEILSREARPVRLQDLVRARFEGRVPRRAVVLTFDDGYADNLYQARPLLERYEVPATVFVCTGYAGRAFWWDEVAQITKSGVPGEKSRALDRALDGAQRIEADGKALTWGLYRQLLPLSLSERDRLLDRVRSWATSFSVPSDSHRALTDSELTKLFADNLVAAGAHTVSHRPLGILQRQDQAAEILDSKVRLEELLGRPVSGFSYPNGSLCPETMQLVREAGFAYACASHNDVAWRGSHVYCLPRFWVPDVDGDRFQRWLRRWIM